MSRLHFRKAVVRRFHSARRFLVELGKELARTRVFDVAAALSFYFLLSLVPLLIVISSLLSFLPVPTLFDQLLDLMSLLVPPESMDMVQKIVTSVLGARHGGLLSFGVLSYTWAASGGFSAVIESLDTAYRVKGPRPWWKTRLRALLLTATTGAMVTLSLLVLVAGPGFGRALATVFPVPTELDSLWRLLRLGFAFGIFWAGIVILYVIGPNTRISFRSAMPGALLAVFCWFAGSSGLAFYLQHLSNYDATYGSLGAVIALMLWFTWWLRRSWWGPR